ncbi:hypothetical protein RFI_01921 [Reticulomyxa filosa]|uniref:Uncharacterized protein n=1 Tax=Reticulomyxa filosa TaxID=46433 RepID=X6PBV3_RETFI|nr:hypothetical protein RFI_01921 [Reticulomyxa filosa]|eukprot:ETO35152.1 hypothetical protein RFI_01921 [Reticulomyxa filosa]
MRNKVIENNQIIDNIEYNGHYVQLNFYLNHFQIFFLSSKILMNSSLLDSFFSSSNKLTQKMTYRNDRFLNEKIIFFKITQFLNIVDFIQAEVFKVYFLKNQKQENCFFNISRDNNITDQFFLD